MSLSAPTVILKGASVTKILTVAETLALNTTAITIVPSPGAGKALMPREFVLSKGAGTVGAAGGNITFRFGTASITPNLGRSSLFTAAARTYLVNPAAGIRLLVNTSINIHMATADMTGNDVPLAVTVIYDVVSTQ
jgi:hypothetical protein